MIPIKAIYNIPSIKHTFFVVKTPKKPSSLTAVSKSLKRRKYLDEIRQKKHNPCEMNVQKWVSKAVSESDMYAVMFQEKRDGMLLDYGSFKNPGFMELLTIRAVNHPAFFLDSTLNSPKVLDVIQEEDILEVFIA